MEIPPAPFAAGFTLIITALASLIATSTRLKHRPPIRYLPAALVLTGVATLAGPTTAAITLSVATAILFLIIEFMSGITLPMSIVYAIPGQVYIILYGEEHTHLSITLLTILSAVSIILGLHLHSHHNRPPPKPSTHKETEPCPTQPSYTSTP